MMLELVIGFLSLFQSANATINRAVMENTPTAYGANIIFKGPRPWADVRAFGAKGDGVTDDFNAFNNAISTLSSVGGGILYIPQGTYEISAALVFSSDTRVVGASTESSIIVASGLGYHLLRGARSLSVEHLTLQRADAGVTTAWKAINIDYSNFPPEQAGTRLYVNDVHISGFDIGVYTDGGATGIEMSSVTNSTITINALHNDGGGAVIPTVNLNNSENVIVSNNYLVEISTNQINNGYFIGNRILKITSNHFLRGIQAKVVTNSNRVVENAIIENNLFDSSSLSILTQTDTNPIQQLIIKNNVFKNSRVLDGATGDITLNNLTASTSNYAYGLVDVDGNYFYNGQRTCVLPNMSSGETLKTITLHNNYYYNWSLNSPGTYAAVSTGGLGTYQQVVAVGEYADGANNGRAYANLGTASSVSIGGITELNTQVPGQGLFGIYRTGYLQLPSYTTTQLGAGGTAPAPTKTGVQVYNSTIKEVCVSTGTAASNWALIGSKGATGCF